MRMALTDFARHSIIPTRVLRYLLRKGFIHDPLNYEDSIGLSLLEKIWCRREVLRAQITRFSKRDRLQFITTADLPSRWERYAYSRFSNIESGKKLPMRTLIMEIENTFGFQPDAGAIRKLYRVRNRAQVHRHREKSLAKQQQEISYQAQTKK